MSINCLCCHLKQLRISDIKLLLFNIFIGIQYKFSYFLFDTCTWTWVNLIIPPSVVFRLLGLEPVLQLLELLVRHLVRLVEHLLHSYHLFDITRTKIVISKCIIVKVGLQTSGT